MLGIRWLLRPDILIRHVQVAVSLALVVLSRVSRAISLLLEEILGRRFLAPALIFALSFLPEVEIEAFTFGW